MHFLSMSLADLLSGWQPGATLLFLHRPENRSSNYSALSALSSALLVATGRPQRMLYF